MSTIRIHGTATFSAPCQNVAIGLVVRRSDPSSRTAREKAKASLDELHTRLQKLAESGIRFDPQGMAAHFSLDVEHRLVDGTAKREYEATYALSLVSEDHARFVEIFETVTDVEGLEASSPRFSIDGATEQKLRNKAFIAAVDHAKRRFAFQCDAIGLDPKNYEVSTWTYTRGASGSSGKRLAVQALETHTGGGPVSATIDIELTFERKLR